MHKSRYTGNMRWFFLSLVLFAAQLCAGISLKDKLQEAVPGSFLVTEQDKTYTLLHVYEKQGALLVLEEVSIPATRFPANISFHSWFERGAPGHTSWLMSQINLTTGRIEESFSFTHQGWVDLTQTDSFLSTLLNLHFQEVSDLERRRVGLPPGYGKPDYRPLWSPRLTVEGNVYPNIPFTVWKARWPSDGSDLARKQIEVYLPVAVEGTIGYPAYFPYWLEVEGKVGSAKIRVIDSGMDAHSPKPPLPLRPATLLKSELNKTGLHLTLQAPSYFRTFLVLAEEVNGPPGATLALPCASRVVGENVIITVSHEELTKCMRPETAYRFLISPEEAPSLCLETEPPLIFRQS